jgi:hypothetical protein
MKKHQTVKTATLAYLMEPSLPIVAPVGIRKTYMK